MSTTEEERDEELLFYDPALPVTIEDPEFRALVDQLADEDDAWNRLYGR